MKKINRILSVCAVLALLIGCAVFSANAAATVTPSNDTYTEATACPHCGEVVTWTELTTINDDIVTASGHYVVKAGTTLTHSDSFTSIGKDASDVAILVAGNIEFSGSAHLRVGNTGTTTTWLIGGGGTISGGHAPTSTPNPSLVGVYANGTLNIIGNITIKGNETEAVTANRGGVINVYSTGRVNMYGGTVTPFNLAADNEDSYAGIYLRTGGTFNMHGGSIAGGSAKYGPCVYIANGTFTMDGGSISGGTSTGSGAAIYLSAGSMNISGNAQVTGGTCGASGGILYQSGGSATISGNAQLTGSASNYGGVAYIDKNGTFEVSGNAQLTGASVKNYGGTIYCNGILNVNGGTITGGTAVTGGGAISTNGGTINITGGNITGGEAANGGTINLRSGTLIMTGGTITGGTARNDGSGNTTGHGGVIYNSATNVQLNGGTISGGRTVRAKDANNKYQGGDGGAIYMAANSALTLDGAEICNSKGYRGGNIFVSSGSTFTMKSGSIYGGDATNQGGAVFISGTFNMSGGTVTGNPLSTYATAKCFRVQGKLNLSGDAKVISAGGAAGNALDAITSSAVITLADNAIVENQTNANAANIILRTYNSAASKLTVKEGWTGSASVYFDYIFGEAATVPYASGMAISSSYATATGAFIGKLYMESAPNLPPLFWDGSSGLKAADVQMVSRENGKDVISWFDSNNKAVAAYAVSDAQEKYLNLFNSNPINLAGNTVTVEFNGFSNTVSNGTLQGTDASALGTGTGTTVVTLDGANVKTISTAPATGETFIAITDGNKATFHAVTANITSITVRPDKLGMYYSAKFVCDDTVKAHLDTFGVALSLSGMPDADFANNKSVLYTAATKDQLASGEYNSVLVKGIMKDTLAADANKSRGEMPVYANAYLKLTVNDEPITVMATNTSQHSLKTMLQEINTYWDTFPETAQSDLATKIYEPYVRKFEKDDWKIYNIRIEANGGYTLDEKAILKQRQNTVLAYMLESISLLWRSDKELVYGLGNTMRDNGASFTIVPGRLYMGLPYSYAVGTQDSFLEYAASEPDANGIYTITGLDPTGLNYESYGGRVGNDCSGAVTNAWSQISTSITASTSRSCNPNYGVVPIGDYDFCPDYNASGSVIGTEKIVETNGQQKIFEAYALLQPADAIYHQDSSSSGGNHIRMVKTVDVKYNTDGTINGATSKITVLEQTRRFTNATTTTTLPGIDETVYVIGGIDVTYTFNTLFGECYIPVTIPELRDPTPVEETWIEDTLEEKATIDNLFTGIVTSNRYIDAVRITITDEEGKVVQQVTGRARRNYNKRFQMERFITEKPGSMMGTLDLSALAGGTYKCTVTAKLTIDDDYIHTVRDFTFSK